MGWRKHGTTYGNAVFLCFEDCRVELPLGGGEFTGDGPGACYVGDVVTVFL